MLIEPRGPERNSGAGSSQESEDARRARRAKAWTRVVRPGDAVDLELEDALYWLQLTPEQRFLEVCQLSEEIALWMEPNRVDELRFSRSVARLLRI